MNADIGATLREILAEVTDVEDPAQRGPDDDLFAYGLTSLETVRLLRQIETRYGLGSRRTSSRRTCSRAWVR
jgi:acyl carrier protein